MSVPARFLNGLLIRRSVVFSGNTLLLYDYLITFPLELQYIWDAPWTPVKAGFLVNRYGNMIGQTFILLEEAGYLSHGSEKFCVFYRLYCTLFMIFSAESIRILVLMRAWAIWGCQYGIAVSLVTSYVLYIFAILAAILYSQLQYKSPPLYYLSQVGVCISPIPPHIWSMWLATLVIDTIVLVMIWHSLRKLFKESRGIYPSPLVHLLVRDAILFYAASVFNNVFSIVCWTVFRQDPRCFLQLGLSFPLLSVTGQRLILNLRGFQARLLTTRDISVEVDRQMAAMPDLLWPDLEMVNDEQVQLHVSDHSSKPSRTGGMSDPAFELEEMGRASPRLAKTAYR